MASSENQQQHPDPAPPSFSAGDHETRDYYASQAASQPPSQQEPYLTPYLGLRARLSQTWINRWTILLLLVLIRTLLAIASLDDNLVSARKEALSACTSVENVGSALASLPHYMADGVNDLTATGVTKAINGLMQMLILTVTGVEEIVLFIINLLTSTYVCLITLAVAGSLHVAIAVAEDVGNFLNSTAQAVGKDLGGATQDFQSAMNGFLSDVDKLGSLLSGQQLTPPTIDLSGEIGKLNALQLPQGYDQGLNALNNSIPTFAQVQNFTNNAIKFPFEEVKKLLNESLPKYTMDRSLFPVPNKTQLTFCSDNDGINDFFDDLVNIEQLAKKVFLVVIILLAVLAMIPMAYREYRRWIFMRERARLITDGTRDPMDTVYLVSRPYTSTTGVMLAKRFKSGRRQALVRWTIAYATTVPALFILSLAVAGLLGCLCQYILLKAVEKEVPALTAEVGAFADKVLAQLNSSSESWALGTNHVINDTNSLINKDVLGWVNTTTTAVNNTLNVFVDDMMLVLNATFGSTVLYDPILEVLNCLVLLKVRGIEDGLTWVSDHAHVDFPMLDANTFSLGAMSKVAGTQNDILATGPGQNASNEIASAVTHVTDIIAKAIWQETIISACVLIIWLIIAMVGVVRALVLMSKGGDAGTFRDVQAGPSILPPAGGVEKHELQDFFGARVPTYEQATSSKDPSDHSANKLRGQTYTLAPNPLPTFEHTRATSPIMQTGFSPTSEKLGIVGGQSVDTAVRRPTHIRMSSHGDYAVTSPTTPRIPRPSTTNPEDKRNPFADPVR